MPDPPLSMRRDSDPYAGRSEEPYYPVRDQPDATGPPPVDRDARPYPVFEPERRFSIGATFLGWAVASFFVLALTALLSAAVGGIAAAADPALAGATLAEMGLIAAAGVLLVVFVAYAIGGYAAGRISLWDGAKHGALTVVWAVLSTVLLALIGILAAGPIDVNLAPTTGAGQLAWAYTILFTVLLLVVMVAGGALGGRVGERLHDSGAGWTVRSTRSRGRPL